MSDVKRILLADDHAVLRSGLRLLIDKQDDLEVVGEAGDGRETLSLAIDLQPDVILLDINMPGLDGLQTLPRIKEQIPDSRVLILTMHDDIAYLQQALQAGAAGYVLKQAVDTELLMAIYAVLRGEQPVHPVMTQKLIESMTETQEKTETNPWQQLSEREHDVLRLVALGFTNAEVADELFISVKTVETYRARGMEKLELETRAQLVKSALMYGILTESGKP
ncbi:MAG: DNA-binding response regulator [Anaerolineaceae bacterium]|nr:DNA-binding response regulator [Anaerolineaceae bacterium]MCA9884530.1 response regulator transcription factor [Anaerolineae bacterium]MCA9886886.1 response regulator transcription factor [Anaerolineae bacterium]MCA9891379.1 response regulator transcription factor [Anaerolineae bacterium]